MTAPQESGHPAQIGDATAHRNEGSREPQTPGADQCSHGPITSGDALAKTTKTETKMENLARIRDPQPPITPMEMIDRAVSSGASVEALEKLMALQERWEANQGRKAFDHAIAEAKAEIPPILKNRNVDFTTQKGRTNYKFEDLAEIAKTVDPILSKNGLSYRFRTRQDGGNVVVSCILSHRDGYSEETTLSCPPDNSGNKNPIQAVGSATTYLQRYTLKLALGLAASVDDDGRAAEKVETISADQFFAMQGLIEATATDPTKFAQYLKVDNLETLTLKQFDTAMAALRHKQKQAGSK